MENFEETPSWEICLFEYCKTNRLSMKEVLKKGEPKDFAIFNHPPSYDISPRGWIALDPMAHKFLIYRVHEFTDKTEFKMNVTEYETCTFVLPDINVKASFLEKMGAQSQEHISAPSESPSHWREKHFEIAAAALQIVSEFGAEPNSKLWKTNAGKRVLNASAIANEINDRRNRWRWLGSETVGTTPENILKTVRKALKD